MNHPLAVYTVIYFAILLTAYSMWAGDIATASGDSRVLLFCLGAFSIKLAIDDYLHFSKPSKHLQTDLILSLAVCLLLASSIANAALSRPALAPILFASVFGVGSIWLCVNGALSKNEPDKRRRRGWLVVNIVSAGLLIWAASLGVQKSYSPAAIPLTILFLLIVADFFLLGTLRRLAAEGHKTFEASASPAERSGEAAASQVPAVDKGLAESGGVDYKQAMDDLLERITKADLASELGVSQNAIAQTRLDPSTRGFRPPPAGWQAAIARLAGERASRLLKLKAALDSGTEVD